MKLGVNFNLFVLLLAGCVAGVISQSTCPVVQPQSVSSASNEQKCKCGIKIDGHIYIYCARKQLARLPKFTRSSILYDELILSGNRIETIQVGGGHDNLDSQLGLVVLILV